MLSTVAIGHRRAVRQKRERWQTPENGGGIVVLDLNSGHSRLLLTGDRSAIADPKQYLRSGRRKRTRTKAFQICWQETCVQQPN
jgi:hypothetical protein